MNNCLTLIILLAAALPSAAAGDKTAPGDRLASGSHFSDPAFQDMVETGDGYLNSKNTHLLRSDFNKADARPEQFRDAPAAVPAAALRAAPPPAAAKPAARPAVDRPDLPDLPQGHYKVTFAGESGPVGSYVRPLDAGSKRFAREYALLGVAVKGPSYDQLLPKLEAAGLRFAGEKNTYTAKSRRTVILGWAPYSAFAAIAKVPGVLGVAVEKKTTGVPMKARVRFTLKVPFQNKPNAFVPAFIRRLEEEEGFASEKWFRLPQKGGDSRFSVFEVDGVLPVSAIGELSRSPFVASVEFNDPSL